MELFHNIFNGGLSASMSLALTYPIDMWKTNLQVNSKNNFNFKGSYRGISQALLLTFPEKGLKLGIYQHYKLNNNDEFSLNGCIVGGLVQGIFTTPIDNIKVKNLKKIKIKNSLSYFRGLHLIYSRDIPFNIIFFGLADKYKLLNNNSANNLLSGFIATSLVTPVDVIKTKYQDSHILNKNLTTNQIIKNLKYNDYFKGLLGRNLSVGVFYGLTYTIFNKFFD